MRRKAAYLETINFKKCSKVAFGKAGVCGRISDKLAGVLYFCQTSRHSVDGVTSMPPFALALAPAAALASPQGGHSSSYFKYNVDRLFRREKLGVCASEIMAFIIKNKKTLSVRYR
jgi:hypothetical protein